MMRGRSEQHVDGRAVQILLRSAPNAEPAAVQVSLHPRRRNVDAASPDRLPIDSMGHRERPDAVQDGRKLTRDVGAYMQDDEYRRRQVSRKPTQQRDQCFDASRRCADDDDIMIGHDIAANIMRARKTLESNPSRCASV